MEVNFGTLLPHENEDSLEFLHVEPEPDHFSVSLAHWVLVNAQDDDGEHPEVISDDLTYSDALGDRNHDELEFFGPFQTHDMEDKGNHNRSKGYYGDDDDDDGLDDELVPLSVRGKLVRQRMRKVGKRHFSKMKNSKRRPHLYVKPGCLHGKHGLGMKHSV